MTLDEKYSKERNQNSKSCCLIILHEKNTPPLPPLDPGRNILLVQSEYFIKLRH